jgi:multisubunit Na+/H+ antiporter MnhE subunit
MRRVAAWLAWLGGLLVLWLLLVGTVQGLEVIAGLAAAAIGATAAEVVRSRGLLRYRVEWRWIRRGARQLLLVVPDFFRVLAALASRPRGSFRTVPFPAGGERDVDRGRRAFATLAASLAPSRLVVDLDPETGEALVHDLRPRAQSAEELL